MKVSKEITTFLCIVILGFILRLLFIEKPSGFWHNEMVIYNQSIADFPFGIIKSTIQNDVHFPLYQLFLSVWIKIFSNNDIVIRFFSVLLGTLNIVFAFLTGKEFKDEKLGNILALLTAINATLIFYSQEVKFYIMLALLSSMSLFFLARIKNKNDNLSHLGYILSTTAIVYTFTIGIFYAFASFIAFLLYTFIRDKGLTKKFLISNLLMSLLVFPFVWYVFFNFGKYENASWIFTSNFFTFFVLIQNYFSPALIAIYNNPVIYVPVFSTMPIIFIYIPVGLKLYGIYKSIKVNKDVLFILTIPILFLFCEIVLSCNSGFRILTRYTILAIMPLLLIVSIGFYYFKPKLLKFAISYLIIANIFFLVAVPTSAVRGYRDLGQKPVAETMMQNKIKDNDTIIMTLRKNDFDKYLTFSGRKFSMLEDFVHSPYALDSRKMPDKYEAYRAYIFDTKSINKTYEEVFLNTIIKPMKPHSRIFFVWDESYYMYPLKDKSHYHNYPIMTLSLSKMNADTLKLCLKYLKYDSGIQLDHYKLLIFKNY